MEPTDVELLLAVLNGTPDLTSSRGRRSHHDVVDGWLTHFGPSGSPRELAEILRAGELLQDVVRGTKAPHVLVPLLDRVARTPSVRDGSVQWTLRAPPQRMLAVRAVLAWAEVTQSRPGRLRACANPECRLFLLDYSKGNTARWCSMATCGNRLKARRHRLQSRERSSSPQADVSSR